MILCILRDPLHSIILSLSESVGNELALNHSRVDVASTRAYERTIFHFIALYLGLIVQDAYPVFHRLRAFSGCLIVLGLSMFAMLLSNVAT